ncbi:MAG: hypothetical protein V9G24_11705 [Rhodoblastus sp.]
MRQAIEEGFILDVLKNYTPYKLAFKLAHDGKEWDEKEVERSAAMKGHHGLGAAASRTTSAQKVQIVVEHFRENVAPLLDGQAKAMVVVGSRVEAVRWQLAIDKLHQGQRLQDRHAGGLLRRGERPGDPARSRSPRTARR